jgi:hypothetical protein
MTSAKIKSLRSLRTQMKAIARGKRPAPVDAARSSFNSVAALVRLLTPDNRQLLVGLICGLLSLQRAGLIDRIDAA